MDIKPYTFEEIKEARPHLFGGELHYVQPADDMQYTTSAGYNEQELYIGSTDAGAGKYFYIKTERWAFDSLDQLKELLEDAMKRAGD